MTGIVIDASALTAIYAGEPEGAAMLRRIEFANIRVMSPLGLWEAATALARIFARDPVEALADLEAFIRLFGVDVATVDAETARLAMGAFARYGKGRHPAGLNFGNCFAYACAREHRLPLLYKGDDFALTDIEAA